MFVRGTPPLGLGLGLGLMLACVGPAAGEEGVAWTEAGDSLPSWASENTLQLQLSTDSTNYAVIPLTEKLASGSPGPSGSSIDIRGNLLAADDTNYNTITSSDDIAYLCCDKPRQDTYIDPGRILNELMKQAPRAIILYSTASTWCSLSYKGDLTYTAILSMVDTGEATTVLDHVNDTDGRGTAVTIFGNATNLDMADGSGGGKEHKSAVAMSVLYSITGLITFLFLAIIINGAIRAHRHPERYGPRRAAGGRPRQSRAKGIARAALETLPVVKFGDQRPSKPDPDLEMDDAATTDGQVAAAQGATPSATSGGAAAAASNTAPAQPDAGPRSPRASTVGSEASAPSAAGSSAEPGANLGCSICTEDFRVGEDVRVLPCHHQFHPECVDPWLINVSGTCPLCRLDLRPGHEANANAGSDTSNNNGGSNASSSPTNEDDAVLPPPLDMEQDGDTPPQSRPPHLVDLNRLRQAPAEEQMEMLRSLRDTGARSAPNQDAAAAAAAAAAAGASTDGEDHHHHHHGARFANRLKDKFRILTRTARRHDS